MTFPNTINFFVQNSSAEQTGKIKLCIEIDDVTFRIRNVKYNSVTDRRDDMPVRAPNFQLGELGSTSLSYTFHTKIFKYIVQL